MKPDETEAGLFFPSGPVDNDDDLAISDETLAGLFFLSAPVNDDALAIWACVLETGFLYWAEADNDRTLFLIAPLSAFMLSTAGSGLGSVWLLLLGVLNWDIVILPGNVAEEAAAGSALQLA